MDYAIDDTEFNIKVYSPTCMSCNNLTSLEKRTCNAFTKEIPLEIWQGDNNHSKPYKGDNGIQFEKTDTTKAANVGALSGTPGFVPKPPAYDGPKKPIKTKKLEDKTLDEIKEWITQLNEEAKKEVERLYDTS